MERRLKHEILEANFLKVVGDVAQVLEEDITAGLVLDDHLGSKYLGSVAYLIWLLESEAFKPARQKQKSHQIDKSQNHREHLGEYRRNL